MYRISYYKHENGNYFVTLQSMGQTIVLLPGFFVRVMRIPSNVLMGCLDVDVETLQELGFVVPEQFLRKTI